MKKYTFYAVFGEDGGGEGACLTEAFIPIRKYDQDDGTLLCATEAIVEFDDAIELVEFFKADGFDYRYYDLDYAMDLIHMAEDGKI